MKISELINKLQEIQENCGDLHVLIDDSDIYKDESFYLGSNPIRDKDNFLIIGYIPYISKIRDKNMKISQYK